MWSKLIVCLFVGLAIASTNPGWRDNNEYVYIVRGRTVANLHEVSNQNSGILLKAKLTIRPVSDEHLMGKLSDAKYAQLHAQLPEGWNSDVSDSQVSWKPLEISEKFFKIVMNHGVVQDVITNGDISNWEANVIRSIVSQFQLDTKAQNLIPSPVNTLPDGNTNTATFKTMEDTVTGNTETLYDIHLLPEYIIQNKPWLAPKFEREANEQVIEIVKHKNYSNSAERPSYHFGLFNMGYMEPTSNKMGQFFTRSSISRITVVGSLNRFTIQNTYTVNRIIMNPTLTDKQKGSVVSMLNITLSEVHKQSGKAQEIANPISLGNLVYRYNQPFASNKVRPTGENLNQEQEELISSEESLLNQGRFRRNSELSHKLYNDLIYSSLRERYAQRQEQAELHLAPKAPLLPFTVGYKGNSIKKDKNFKVVETANKIAQEIGQDVQQPEKMLKEDTLAKFSILATLTRIMDAEELRQVVEQVYTNEQTGPKYGAWIALRDAVAESGTGPALLIVQEMIESGKLKNEDASGVVTTMALSVREPTLEYMRTFYSLLKSEQVGEQHELQDTILLSFTDLLREVYVNKQQSHNKYPVHSFGSFRTEEGKSFVTKTVIPALKQKLDEAIANANSHKILMYVRALGNIGHREILPVFEPYLEGIKQVSQFQRLWMVASLDKLVQVDAVRARSVLYKIYQNLGETPEIRSTAVFQIIRTSPPSNLLQRMAEFTNIDTSKTVNAAVKSSIENAAKMQGEEFHQLRDSAKSALPLITKEEFKTFQAGNQIRSFVFEELNVMYKHTLQYVSDDNSIVPKLLKFAFRSKNGGMRHQWAIVQGLVSSIDELLNVVQVQTENFKESQQQNMNGQNSQWSSQNIARLLNLKSDEREQLEGLLDVKIGSLRKLVTFDNNTLDMLPLLVREIEHQLENGKSVRLTKFQNRNEVAFSFPTEMGFPFLYTYDTPTLLSLQARIQGSAKPKMSVGNRFKQPETITGEGEMQLVISSKVKGKLSFITPFDHEQYSAGFDKVYQMHLPLRGKIEINVKEQQIKSEIEPLKSNEKVNILHISTWPYTSVHNIMNMEPLSIKNHIIRQKNQKAVDEIFGKRETGLAIRMRVTHENDQLLTLANIMHNLQKGECVFVNDDILQNRMDITYLPEESTSQKLSIHLGKQYKYKSQSNDDKHDLSHLYNSPSQSIARQQDFERKAGSNMRNAEVTSYDASFEFEGRENFKYTFTGAVAKSNVDPTSRILFYFKKYSNTQDPKPYQVAVSAKMHIPNTNELNLNDALKHEPTGNAQVHMAFGREYETSSKVKAEIEMNRNQQTKQIITEHPLYQVCKTQMTEGNNQLPACANLTRWANRMDVVRVKLQHHNINEQVARFSRSIFDMLRLDWSLMMEINHPEKTSQDECEIEYRVNPNWMSFNASLKGQDVVFKIADIPLNMKSILTQRQQPYCVADVAALNTFNNRTAPLTLNSMWTVLFQYVPQRARDQHRQSSVEELLKKQIENYVVLARQHQGDKTRKEVKITFNTPETEGETMEINMRPVSGRPSAKVMVNGQEVKINENESHEIKRGLVEIYALNNGEVKMVIRNAFDLVFDGSRVRISSHNDKFRNAVRGVCGQFNENPDKDNLTPENCVVGDLNKLVESYRVQEGKQRQVKQDKHCSNVQVLFANVISDIDAGRDAKYDEQLGSVPRLCTIHQTRYIEENNQICFTRRSYPICKCQQRGTVEKEVSVHCVEKSQVTDMWKKQIEKGLSPSFENKAETKKLNLQVPKSCTM